MGNEGSKPGGDNKRRVLKAKKPQSSSSDNDATHAAAGVEDDTRSIDNNFKEVNYVPPTKANYLMNEEEQELSEKWRNERLENKGKIQKMHRDAEIQEKRKHGSTTPPPPATNTTITGSAATTNPDFSVQPKFPEHKRSVELTEDEKKEGNGLFSTNGGTTESELEPSHKRTKASDPDEEKEKELPSSSSSSSPWDSTIKMVVPAVAVAAIAIYIGMKYTRRS